MPRAKAEIFASGGSSHISVHSSSKLARCRTRHLSRAPASRISTVSPSILPTIPLCVYQLVCIMMLMTADEISWMKSPTSTACPAASTSRPSTPPATSPTATTSSSAVLHGPPRGRRRRPLRRRRPPLERGRLRPPDRCRGRVALQLHNHFRLGRAHLRPGTPPVSLGQGGHSHISRRLENMFGSLTPILKLHSPKKKMKSENYQAKNGTVCNNSKRFASFFSAPPLSFLHILWQRNAPNFRASVFRRAGGGCPLRCARARGGAVAGAERAGLRLFPVLLQRDQRKDCLAHQLRWLLPKHL